MKNRIQTNAFLWAIFLVVLFTPVTSFAYTFYQELTIEPVMPGVQYEKRRRITDKGLLDIHVLRVALDSPYVEVQNISSDILGKKETTSSMATKEGAVAAVNGDFFGMNGQYSGPLGLSVTDGVASISDTYNVTDKTSPSFYITTENEAFIDFFTTKLSFTLDGEHVLPVGSVNKAFNINYPFVLTGDKLSSSQEVDNRFRSQKIVVSNGEIIRITQGAETVSIPADGFALFLKEGHEFLEQVTLGQKAHIYIESSINLKTIDTAISGLDLILDNGQISPISAVPSGRHPRTAIGLNQDQTELLMVVVDGRSLSVGASHEDMAHIMSALGAYDAFHLDGGGSSTMVTMLEGADTKEVVNQVSDARERGVINALGIFNNAPVGEATKLVITASDDQMIHGKTTELSSYALDDYAHKIHVPIENCTVEVSGGHYENGLLYADIIGTLEVTVTYETLETSFTIESINIEEIQANVHALTRSLGSKTALMFMGISESGFSTPINSAYMQYEVVPPTLGYVENHTYISASEGVGYLKATYNGGITRYIAINNTLVEKPFGSLDQSTQRTVSTTPDYLTAVSSDALEHTVDGNGSIHLSYTLDISEETQAAYINFPQIILPEAARALTTYAKGSGSHHWLRGRIVDANGVSYTIEFAQEIKNTFTKVTAALPDEAVRPLQLAQIYVASLAEAAPSTYELYIDTLGVSVAAVEDAPMPPSSTYKDPWARNHIEMEAMGEVLLVNTEKIQETTKATMIYYPINTSNGSIMKTAPAQWETIQNLVQGNNTFIVFHFDQLPSNFSIAEEYELFHNLMVTATKNGKRIIILGNGSTNDVHMKDGIRYIELQSTIELSPGLEAIYYNFE